MGEQLRNLYLPANAKRSLALMAATAGTLGPYSESLLVTTQLSVRNDFAIKYLLHINICLDPCRPVNLRSIGALA